MFIVSGTNNNYLSFLRQKNVTEEIILKKSKSSYKNEYVDLILGRIDFIDKQPIVITPKNLNLDNLRVLING